MLDKTEAIKQLNALAPTGSWKEGTSFDNEGIHDEADEILLECVDPEIKAVWLDIRDRVGFWYS